MSDFISVEYEDEVIVIAADSIAHARFKQWASNEPNVVVVLKQRGLVPAAREGQFTLVNTRYEFRGSAAKSFWDQFLVIVGKA